jgi:hypothetical protein
MLCEPLGLCKGLPAQAGYTGGLCRCICGLNERSAYEQEFEREIGGQGVFFAPGRFEPWPACTFTVGIDRLHPFARETLQRLQECMLGQRIACPCKTDDIGLIRQHGTENRLQGVCRRISITNAVCAGDHTALAANAGLGCGKGICSGV